MATDEMKPVKAFIVETDDPEENRPGMPKPSFRAGQLH